MQTKVCVQSAKKRVLDCLDDERLKAMVTLKWTEGSVHVLPMRQLNARVSPTDGHFHENRTRDEQHINAHADVNWHEKVNEIVVSEHGASHSHKS